MTLVGNRIEHDGNVVGEVYEIGFIGSTRTAYRASVTVARGVLRGTATKTGAEGSTPEQAFERLAAKVETKGLTPHLRTREELA